MSKIDRVLNGTVSERFDRSRVKRWGNQCKVLGQVMYGSLSPYVLGKQLRDDRSEKVVHPNHPDIGSVTSNGWCRFWAESHELYSGKGVS